MRIAFHFQHPTGEHHQANRSAAFAVGGIVGQIVVASKSFADPLRADSSGDIHPTLYHVVPDPQAGLTFLFVIGHTGDMRQAGHQIDRTYGVADRFVLFSERFVRMGVSFVFDHSRPGVAPTDPVPGTAAFFELDIVIVGLLPSLFDEEAGQRLIARFPGDFIQAHQR